LRVVPLPLRSFVRFEAEEGEADEAVGVDADAEAEARLDEDARVEAAEDADAETGLVG
jgi:hypothetical protein